MEILDLRSIKGWIEWIVAALLFGHAAAWQFEQLIRLYNWLHGG